MGIYYCFLYTSFLLHRNPIGSFVYLLLFTGTLLEPHDRVWRNRDIKTLGPHLGWRGKEEVGETEALTTSDDALRQVFEQRS